MASTIARRLGHPDGGSPAVHGRSAHGSCTGTAARGSPALRADRVPPMTRASTLGVSIAVGPSRRCATRMNRTNVSWSVNLPVAGIERTHAVAEREQTVGPVRESGQPAETVPGVRVRNDRADRPARRDQALDVGDSGLVEPGDQRFVSPGWRELAVRRDRHHHPAVRCTKEDPHPGTARERRERGRDDPVVVDRRLRLEPRGRVGHARVHHLFRDRRQPQRFEPGSGPRGAAGRVHDEVRGDRFALVQTHAGDWRESGPRG